MNIFSKTNTKHTMQIYNQDTFIVFDLFAAYGKVEHNSKEHAELGTKARKEIERLMQVSFELGQEFPEKGEVVDTILESSGR